MARGISPYSRRTVGTDARALALAFVVYIYFLSAFATRLPAGDHRRDRRRRRRPTSTTPRMIRHDRRPPGGAPVVPLPT
jgi:hypothetical protein